CCARLGLRCKYLGVTGTDENGRRIRAEMTHHQVDMADAVIRDVPNQFAVIIVDETTGERIGWGGRGGAPRERTALGYRDEELRVRPGEIPVAPIRATRLVHVDDVDQNAAIEAEKIGRE